ncbi:MAG: hypothetical protein GY906_11435 [bacterium]|nr:hypothetical protein [bacterium]
MRRYRELVRHFENSAPLIDYIDSQLQIGTRAALCYALSGAIGFVGEPLPDVLRCGACQGSGATEPIEAESEFTEIHTPSDGYPVWKPGNEDRVM